MVGRSVSACFLAGQAIRRLESESPQGEATLEYKSQECPLPCPLFRKRERGTDRGPSAISAGRRNSEIFAAEAFPTGFGSLRVAAQAPSHESVAIAAVLPSRPRDQPLNDLP